MTTKLQYDFHQTGNAVDKTIVAIIDIGNTLVEMPDDMEVENNYIKKSINSFFDSKRLYT